MRTPVRPIKAWLPRSVLAAVLAAGVITAIPVIADAGVREAGSGNRSPAAASTPVPGQQLWVNLFRGAADRGASASAVAVSPNGKTVYVSGSSWGTGSSLPGRHRGQAVGGALPRPGERRGPGKIGGREP